MTKGRDGRRAGPPPRSPADIPLSARRFLTAALRALALPALLLPVLTASAAAQVPAPAEPLARESPTPSSAAAPTLEDTAALETFVDGVMTAHFEQLKIPGAVVAVVRGNELLFAKGYGQSSYEDAIPVDPATSLFRIGSASKLFTWTAVMQLAEQGRVDLDADVNTYLRTVQVPATFDEPITLRHLLTHTPGFEDGFLGYLITEDTVGMLSIEEAMSRHLPARVRPPGEFSSYSNYGTALAGLIVEQVSGVPFDDYIERHIFEPLGMRYASFREPLPDPLEPFMTTGYAREAGVFVPKPFELVGGFRPAGSASMSAHEIARFMIAHLHDGALGDAAILRPETARLMHAQAFTHDPRLPGMALGFYEQRINGLRVIGHGGDTFRFHTDMLLVPEHRIGIFVSYVGDGGVPARDGLVRAFFDRYFPDADALIPPTAAASGGGAEAAGLAARADAAPNGAATDNAASRARSGDNGSVDGSAADEARLGAVLEGYGGKYRFLRMSETKIDKVLNLVMPPMTVTALEGDRLLLAGIGAEPAQLTRVGEHLFREVGGHMEVAFRVDEAGSATNAFVDFLPFMAIERVPWYDLPGLWYALFGLSLLLFLSVLVGFAYRRSAVREMTQEERRAVWLSIVTSAWFILTLVVAGIVVASHGATLFSSIPWGLKAVLAMPLVFALLAGALVLSAVAAWRGSYWGTRQRVHFTLVALAAFSMFLLFWNWNLLGWQFG